ncbi:MAG: hypothetical protein IKF51_05335 [Solobacterium sp.]|nr:hypothetical protein [Solobacterium sp.]
MNPFYKYSDKQIVFAYLLIGSCTLVPFHLSAKGWIIVTVSNLLQAGVMLINGKLKHPLMLRRLTGSMIPAFLILILYHWIGAPEDAYYLMSVMFMPIASGTTLVEGLCYAKYRSGRRMLMNAALIALMLELGAFAAVTAGGLLGWL